MHLEEAGIWYTRDSSIALEFGYIPFDYDTYKENEYITRQEVFCRNRRDFEALIQHWNRFGEGNPFHYHKV